MCMIELNYEEQIENKLEVDSNQKNVTRNIAPNSTGRNFFIRDQNSKFHPPLERLQISLGVWYSRFPQNSFGGRLKV
jgi:phage-related protein